MPVDDLIDLEDIWDLGPEELQYLRRLCAKLRALEEGHPVPRQTPPSGFDRDELGIDPEEDAEDILNA